MISWSSFEEKYNINPRDAFENLCYCIFCKQLGVPDGAIRRINQPDIETDPVMIDNNLIGFQSKYYDSRTKLIDKEKEICKTIKGAYQRYSGLTKIYFYVNKELSSNPNNQFAKPNYQIRIEEYAKEFGIDIEWFVKSRIEYILYQPQFRYIYAHFFEINSILPKELLNYYNFVDKIYNSPDREALLVGSYSLKDSYIDAYFIDKGNKRELVIKALENWCKSTKNGVHIILGQPGHGKTSLCIHAVSGFFRDELFQKYEYKVTGYKHNKHPDKKLIHVGSIVRNVFWFSLNPLLVKNIIDINSQNLNLNEAFCWGVEGENKYFTNNVHSLRDSLVFLDGYDELMFKAAQVTSTRHLRDFICKVNGYAEEYGIHFVITSRVASIKNELQTLPEDVGVKVMYLDMISKEQQEIWMRRHNSKESYIKYIISVKNRDMQKILGIPILFRMIVKAELQELTSDNTISLYKRLFEKTMDRHMIPVDDREGYHNELEKVAYKMFCYDDDIISYSANSMINSIGYTYYIEVEKILGFYHRSFYQYFLSHFFYIKLTDINSEYKAQDFLKLISNSIIDTEILYKILEWSRIEKKSTNTQVKILLDLIDRTDALFINDVTATRINRISLCNNAYYNTLSISYILGVQLRESEHKRTCNLMGWYDIRNIVLNNAELNNQSFARVNWEGVVLKNSEINNTDFSYAFLRNAVFDGSYMKCSNFYNAILKDSKLMKADLSGADFIKADLSGSNLSNATIEKCRCEGALFKYANLTKTKFSNIEFTDVDFSNSCVVETYFVKCVFPNCRFYGASLTGVKFYSSILNSINFDRRILLGAYFYNSELNEVSFLGANVVGSCYEKIIVRNTSFRYADLRNARFIDTRIKNTDFTGSDLRGTIFKDTIIINSIFINGDSFNYYSLTKYDNDTEWTGTKVYVDYSDKKYEKTIQFFSALHVEIYDTNDKNAFVAWL